MKDLLIYIGQSGVCISVFLLVYLFLLRGNTFFKFNRIFLIGGLLISFVLPSFKFTYDVIIPKMYEGELALATQNVTIANNNESASIWLILSVIYLFGIGLLIIRNLRMFWSLRNLKRSGTSSKNKECELISHKKIKTPFSVLNQVYINIDSLQAIEKDIILKHEISHIKQKHWIDLLCSECALLLQWFNPLMWYYIYLQKENHEYLADQAVLESGESTAIYRAVLINQRFQGPVFSFANSFNYSNQKNRLNMMKKTKTSPWKKIAVLAVLPLFGAFFAISAKPNYVIDNSKDEVLTIKGINVDSTKKPIVIVDGKEIPFSQMEKIDTKTIKSINVYTGEDAIDKFGEKSKNGVIVINVNGEEDDKNKLDVVVIGHKDRAVSVESTAPEGLKIGSIDGKQVLILIDGVESESLSHLDASEIESINVLKDSATKIYGEKAKNGVILVTTKR